MFLETYWERTNAAEAGLDPERVEAPYQRRLKKLARDSAFRNKLARKSHPIILLLNKRFCASNAGTSHRYSQPSVTCPSYGEIRPANSLHDALRRRVPQMTNGMVDEQQDHRTDHRHQNAVGIQTGYAGSPKLVKD